MSALVVGVAAVVTGVGVASPAGAAGGFTVDVLVDTVDATPGDGVCADASGDCSLRAAILEANALSAAELPLPDEIVLPAGTITLTIAGDEEDAGLTGDLDLWAGVPLRGAGVSSVIDGGGLDRVLDTHGLGLDWWPTFPGPSVALVDLRVTGGVATDGRGGGGIRAHAQGLSLTNVTVDGNRAEHVGAQGGGVLFPVSFDIDGASLTLTDSTITGNEAVGPGASGGGVFTAGGLVTSGGSVTDNQITNANPEAVEASSSLGAGIAAVNIFGTDSTEGASVVVDGTTITGNELVVGAGSETLWGGGIGLGRDVDATITDATISGNVATAGGGIVSWNTTKGDIAIDTSTISGNTAVAGAFPHDGLGGGLLVMGSTSDVLVDGTEISGNAAVIGGGIAATNVFDEVLRTVTVRRSTVSGNTASDHGGGIANHSNLIEFETGTVPPALVLDTSTVSGNTALAGGGLSLGADTVVSMDHATIAANTGGGISTGGASTVAPMTGNVIASQVTGADCTVTAGSGLASGGGSADSDGSCMFGDPTDLSDVDPLLGPLVDNGGSTLTHLPAWGSPLVGAAGACTGTDQRGVERPQGAACDIGSVEVEVLAQWTALDLAGTAATVHAGDFDGDGDEDLFVHQKGGAKDWVHWSQGDGTFVAVERTFTGPYNVSVLDVNGDGIDDLLLYAPAPWGSRVSTWGHGGSSTFTMTDGYTPKVGDFNGDGLDDILWFERTSAPSPLWYSNGTGGWTVSSLSTSYTYRAYVLDANGDAADDLLLYGTDWVPDRLVTFGAGQGGALTMRGVYNPVIGDLDGDTHDDILWHDKSTAGTADKIWWSNGDGTFTPTDTTIAAGVTPTTADLDGDDDLDVVLYGPNATPDALWRSNGDRTFTTTAATIDGTYTLTPIHATGTPAQQIVLQQPGTANDALFAPSL